MMEGFLEILKFSVSNGFWQFVGCWIIIGLIVKLPIYLVSEIWKGININKHGDLECYQTCSCEEDDD